MVVKRLHKRVYRECIAEDRREMMRAPGKDSCQRIDQRVPCHSNGGVRFARPLDAFAPFALLRDGLMISRFAAAACASSAAVEIAFQELGSPSISL